MNENYLPSPWPGDDDHRKGRGEYEQQQQKAWFPVNVTDLDINVTRWGIKS